MPHISKDRKEIYKNLIDNFSNLQIEEKGDLEFLVYQLMKVYMSTRKRRYATLHETVYAVIHSAEEYKRLHLDKREDEAIEINGEA